MPTITYRFRWYRDEHAFDSKDVRQWWNVEADGGLAKGIESMRFIVHKLKEIGAGKVTELLKGNLSTRDFVALLRHQTFAHSKTVTQAEYEAEYGPLDLRSQVRG